MSAASTPGSGQPPTPANSNTSARRFVAGGARKAGAAVDITNVDIVFDAPPPPVVGSLPGQQLSTGFKLPLDEKAKAAQLEELSRKQVAEGQDPFLARRLQQQQSSGPQRPWLQGRSHAAQSAGGGRSLLFGGGALSSRVQQHAPVAAATPLLAHASAATAAADALVSSGTAAALSETKFERAENFRVAMRQSLAASITPLWQTLAAPSTMTSLSLSATCEPWDLPFESDSDGGPLSQLATSTAAAAAPSAQRWDWSRCHNLLHHPVVPVHPMMDDERRAEEEASSSGGMKMIKTKEEIRAERRRAAQEKLEAARKDAAAKKAGGGGAAAHEDQLRWKNLTDASRVQQMISDPHALHAAIEQQYEERFHKHMRDNYDRHVEALPHQAAKKLSDMWRRAEERPRLQVYHVPKARNVHCVNRLRNFANDDKLRGFLLWVGEEELFAVLAGGEVAMRHMDRWMVEKMEWHRPGRLEAGVRGDPTPVLNVHGGGGEDVTAAASKRVRESVTTNAAGGHDGDGDELLHAAKLRRVDPSLLERTTGRLVLSLPLLRVGDVSFLLPRKPLDVMRAQRRTSQADEAVFVRHCDTVEAGLGFVRDELPAGGVLPSLMFAWRQAFDF